VAAPSAGDDVEQRLAKLWCDLLLVDRDIGLDDDFFALGADSLHLVELCTMIADAFGADLLPGELIGRSSLHEMAALVREGALRHERPLLVQLRDGGADRCPLYLVPGAGGTLAAFHRFVTTLEPGRRVFGFETADLYEGDRELVPIADMADRFTRELAAHNDGAPFGLVGFCLGAVITQEMARLLELEGQPPELLVMFDARRPGVLQDMSRLARFKARVWRIRERLSRGDLSAASVVVPREQMSTPVRQAKRAHRVQPTSVPTLMFTSKAEIRRAREPYLGWKPYLRGEVEEVTVARGHQQLLQQGVTETAAAVDDALRRLDRLHGPR
jgi:thioesterase domain-containing protein/acyl carrier protein